MAYDIIIGRDDTDREKFGKTGLIFLGKSYVKMGQTTSLSNNVYLDVNKAHVILICGKRGTGKSYSASVIAEEISRMPEDIKQNISVLIFDTMGIFWTMKFPNIRQEKLLREWGIEPSAIDIDIYTPTGYFKEYQEKGIATDYAFAIKTSDLNAGDWAEVFEVSLTDPIGVIIEKIIIKLKEKENYSVKDIIEGIMKDETTETTTKNAAINRFVAADSWGLFNEYGSTINDIIKAGRVSILDVSCYTSVSGSWGIKNLVINYLCGKLLTSRITSRKEEEKKSIETEGRFFSEIPTKKAPLTWVMIDEAHQVLPKDDKTDGTNAIIQLLREGRQPGISLVLATQQPGEINKEVLTQSDIVLSHKLTSAIDMAALSSMMQSYLLSDINEYINDLPKLTGSAIILDDNSERIYPLRVHPKRSWHGGETPSVLIQKKEFNLNI
ncbi:MAG: DUF87 domain-containing protein [Nanoarchaeota archaeon]